MSVPKRPAYINDAATEFDLRLKGTLREVYGADCQLPREVEDIILAIAIPFFGYGMEFYRQWITERVTRPKRKR